MIKMVKKKVNLKTESEPNPDMVRLAAYKILQDLNVETDGLKKLKADLVLSISEINDLVNKNTLTQVDANIKIAELNNVYFVASKSLIQPIVWDIRTLKDTKEMWLYYSPLGIWKPRAENFIQSWCASNDGYASVGMINNVKASIQGLTWIDREVFVEKIGYINVRNGVIDIKNRKLLPHSPEYNFKYVFNLDWAVNADCPEYKKALSSVLSPIDYKIIQEWLGYLFLPGQLAKKSLFVVGMPNCGKTTLLGNIIANLMAQYVSHQSFANINSDTGYALADIYDKGKANVHGDLGLQKVWDVSNFKQLVGNDPISARQIYSKSFQYKSDSKLAFICNKLPILSADVDDDEAFWIRVLLVEFINPIANINKNFDQILLVESVGILNFAIEGYIRLLQQEFNFTQSDQAAYNQWHNYSMKDNPIIDFFNANFRMHQATEAVPHSWIAKDKIRTMYIQYCIVEGITPLTDASFSIWMKRLNVKDGRHYAEDGEREYTWDGIEEADIQSDSDTLKSAQQLNDMLAEDIKKLKAIPSPTESVDSLFR